MNAEQRERLIEDYKKNRMRQVNVTASKQHVYGKEDMLNLPRHKVYYWCANFEECPLCFKCRAFDPRSAKCLSCELFKGTELCNKATHTPKAISMMKSREVIEIHG